VTPAILVPLFFLRILLAEAPTAAAQDDTSSQGDVLLPGCVETVAELPPSSQLQAADARLQGAQLVVVLKARRRAMVFSAGSLRRGADGAADCWAVALGVDQQGQHPSGAKQRRGDRSTPEGWYRSSDKPWSSFAPAVAIHYPNAADARRGLAAGLISQAQHDGIVSALRAGRKPDQKTRLGGDILFHGGGNHPDWTWGCIAFSDEDNQAFRAALPEGLRTDVLILP